MIFAWKKRTNFACIPNIAYWAVTGMVQWAMLEILHDFNMKTFPEKEEQLS
jgi:hypothetical protein